MRIPLTHDQGKNEQVTSKGVVLCRHSGVGMLSIKKEKNGYGGAATIGYVDKPEFRGRSTLI